MRSGRTHCWSFAEGGGDWTKGACFAPGESRPRGVYKFCSDKVADQSLKDFTCPIDDYRCPSGSEAIIFSDQFDKVSTINDKWSGSRIRSLTHCKI